MVESNGVGDDQSRTQVRLAALGQAVGHTRYVVLVPVVAVLLVAFSLFMLGTIQAVAGVWQAWAGVLQGEVENPDLSATFLKTVIVMLEAVVFFLVGIGLYSLFISPLNLAVALGIQTLHDVEERVISVVTTVMAVTFLEHFIQWRDPLATLQFGAALAVVVVALVLFLYSSHRVNEDQKVHNPDSQERSRRDMFQRDEERHEINPDGVTQNGPKAVHEDTDGAT